MEITQVTRPYKDMRYPTVGDFLYKLGVDRFNFIIAEMGNPDYEMLIFIHELVESYLCWKAQITEEEITAFDVQFEKEGKEGEPGDDPKAPYFKQHQIAGIFEKNLCGYLGIKWKDYDAAVEDIGNA
jgi:hypothetical protein